MVLLAVKRLQTVLILRAPVVCFFFTAVATHRLSQEGRIKDLDLDTLKPNDSEQIRTHYKHAYQHGWVRWFQQKLFCDNIVGSKIQDSGALVLTTASTIPPMHHHPHLNLYRAPSCGGTQTSTKFWWLIDMTHLMRHGHWAKKFKISYEGTRGKQCLTGAILHTDQNITSVLFTLLVYFCVHSLAVIQ